jgi:protein TonB
VVQILVLEVQNNWYKGLKVSCVVHFFAIVLVGALSTSLATTMEKPEEYITLDLVAKPEEMIVPVAQATKHIEQIEQSVMSRSIQAQRNLQNTAGPPTASIAVRDTKIGENSGLIVVTDSANASHTGGISTMQDKAGGYSEGLLEKSGNTVEENSSGSNIDVDGIINAFVSLVERNKEYPYMAIKRGQTGTVTVFVRLDAAGNLNDVEIVESSGVKSLDTSAIKAVKNACPFSHGAGRMLEMSIPIHYQFMG